MPTTTTSRPTSLFDRLRTTPLVEALTWPHGLAGHLSPFDPSLAAPDATRITSVTRHTSALATITFATPREWTEPVAGQHVLLGVEIDGRRQTRAFSLSSSARRDDGRATITVKVNPDGTVSRHLVRSAQVGDVVHVSTPRGGFVLPDEGPLLLVSGGSGITPALAMLRTLVDEVVAGAPSRPVTFLHHTRDLADVPYLAELEHVARRFRFVDLLVVVTGDGPGHGEHGLRGRLDGPQLRRAMSRDVHVRACGPEGLLTTLERLLAADGRHVSHEVEFFRPPTSTGTGGGTITFTTSGIEVVDDGRSLLDQAEAAGLTPQSGCRMGICHTCVRPKAAGTVEDVLTGARQDEDSGEVRLCVTRACGDVAIDL